MPDHYSHERPDDLSPDWELTAIYEDETVRISKVGGGTVGNAYSGWWHYSHTGPDGVTVSGSDLYTGSPTTHAGATAILAEFLDAGWPF